ncbi:imidazole glycerol phosphate synthase subunit HisH [Sphingomonas sp. Root241]|uniref:imidazole glycerol phosphate synthase subunit HisH n=1 Tax=Sphingomonas sp. Root241 TaxID=1736501 RepID=UPI0006F47536|nr:imidazole glycerol phosphate synthase subunit HisH [Sphingomonas sp. Root241]KRC81729.1 imidazole glycerol phosphate synthase subunit HisH [Sphingomonas sp. Root241]
MIAIVDYGVGNIRAFANIYRRLGMPAEPVTTAAALRQADKIILPGVGAFDWSMQRLNDSGMREALDEKVGGEKTPVLGVCVGMQMMARSSEEGVLPGLGWIDAQVVRFRPGDHNDARHLPHMGWNDAEPVEQETLFRDITEPRYYFLHSYYVAPASDDTVLARTQYGLRFASAVRSGNVFGTQFHPEKSHDWGVSLLRNFALL